MSELLLLLIFIELIPVFILSSFGLLVLYILFDDDNREELKELISNEKNKNENQQVDEKVELDTNEKLENQRV